MRIRDEQKELTIREQAVKMIVAEGLTGMSMQKLAKAAKVSPATLYIYFKHREDLINQLYFSAFKSFSDYSLRDFDPKMPFAEGMWQQWKNRAAFILERPDDFLFMEQIRNSPLIQSPEVEVSEFKESMHQFLVNHVKLGSVKPIEPEIFWAIAYGSFYTLVKFHLSGKSMMGRRFELNEERMKKAFDLMIKSFS